MCTAAVDRRNRTAATLRATVEADDGQRIAFLSLVLGDQRGQGFLRLGGQDFAGACQSNFFHHAAGFACVPGIEGGVTVPAGLFSGGHVVTLTHPVGRGAKVAITA